MRHLVVHLLGVFEERCPHSEPGFDHGPERFARLMEAATTVIDQRFAAQTVCAHRISLDLDLSVTHN